MDDGKAPDLSPPSGDVAAADGWRPGNVYITERPPQLSPLGHARGPENRARIAETGEPGQERPHLSEQDFPPHAQREYWAKSGAAQRVAADKPFVYQRQPESPVSKGSLLRRLTGLALSKRQSSGEGQMPKHSGSTNNVGDSREEVDLPVFFGRSKR